MQGREVGVLGERTEEGAETVRLRWVIVSGWGR